MSSDDADELSKDRDNTGELVIGRGYLSQSSQEQDNGGRQLRDRTQVVIVGAGLAGLAAAQRLHANGVSDVIVLDAQNRVGGRVHTIKHSDYLLELGAQWLHGADDNPLHQWLTGMKMLDDFEDASMGFKGTFCTSHSSEQIDARLVERVLGILNESKTNLFNDNPFSTTGKHMTASQVFRQHLEASIANDSELGKNRQLVRAIFEWFLRYETIENCCDHMDEVSVQSYTDWTDLGDGTLLNFKDGYQSLLAWFCDHFPRKLWLHLNKQVLNVELLAGGNEGSCPLLVKYKDLGSLDAAAGGGGVKPITNDQDYGEIKFIECQHVIVTTSLGFLKQNSRSFFTPPLSSVKQTLIDSIGFGTVNKIVLQFERPFWSATGGGVKLVWRDEDFITSTESACDGFPLWARDILAFDVVRRQPNLLIGWIGGQGAKTMETQTDEQVAVVCLRILDKFLPDSHQRPTRLVACLCSRWHSNPFTCGSYSFQSMDSFGLNVDKLHEPIYEHQANQNLLRPTKNQLKEVKFPGEDSNNNRLGASSLSHRVPRIMFAGEATAGKLYSTTHGAVISGWREADRLLDHLATTNKQVVNMMTHETVASLESNLTVRA